MIPNNRRISLSIRESDLRISVSQNKLWKQKTLSIRELSLSIRVISLFFPKTHSWYYPIIRDSPLSIRQKSLIVMVLLAHFSLKSASIFTAKFFMNFPQILKRFHRLFFGFSECFVYVLLSMYFFTFPLYFCWILIE